MLIFEFENENSKVYGDKIMLLIGKHTTTLFLSSYGLVENQE